MTSNSLKLKKKKKKQKKLYTCDKTMKRADIFSVTLCARLHPRNFGVCTICYTACRGLCVNMFKMIWMCTIIALITHFESNKISNNKKRFFHLFSNNLNFILMCLSR